MSDPFDRLRDAEREMIARIRDPEIRAAAEAMDEEPPGAVWQEEDEKTFQCPLCLGAVFTRLKNPGYLWSCGGRLGEHDIRETPKPSRTR